MYESCIKLKIRDLKIMKNSFMVILSFVVFFTIAGNPVYADFMNNIENMSPEQISKLQQEIKER